MLVRALSRPAAAVGAAAQRQGFNALILKGNEGWSDFHQFDMKALNHR
jgi:hypothetical protein